MRFGTSEGSLMGDSGWLGVISAPASFTALKVVPGGVVYNQVGVVYDEVAIEMAATIVAITTGFRSAPFILVNVLVSPGLRSRP